MQLEHSGRERKMSMKRDAGAGGARLPRVRAGLVNLLVKPIGLTYMVKPIWSNLLIKPIGQIYWSNLYGQTYMVKPIDFVVQPVDLGTRRACVRDAGFGYESRVRVSYPDLTFLSNRSYCSAYEYRTRRRGSNCVLIV